MNFLKKGKLFNQSFLKNIIHILKKLLSIQPIKLFNIYNIVTTMPSQSKEYLINALCNLDFIILVSFIESLGNIVVKIYHHDIKNFFLPFNETVRLNSPSLDDGSN